MPKVKSKKKRENPAPFIPYAHGFRTPNNRQLKSAVGLDLDLSLPYFDVSSKLYAPLPPILDSNDWLATNRENGQSYNQFIGTCPWLQNKPVKCYTATVVPGGQSLNDKYPQGTIYLLPVGKFNPELATRLAEYVTLFFGIPTKLLETVQTDITVKRASVKLPNGAVVDLSYRYHCNINNKTDTSYTSTSTHVEAGKEEVCQAKDNSYNQSGDGGICHSQLRIDTGLLDLKQLMPNDGLFMIGMTMHDLYSDISDLFIAGVGSAKDRFGIFSLYRYQPNLQFCDADWYGVTLNDNDPDTDNKIILYQRACRLITHEIGHLLGFNHCIYFSCLMNGSGHLKEDFRQPLHLCPIELRKLCRLTSCDIKQRYIALKRFYTENYFIDEAEWITQWLEIE